MRAAAAKKVQSRKRPERTAGSRAAILRAAGHIFAEKGLEGARTEAIAAAAGVNKALLYYYFKSKDELYLAILEGHMKEFYERASRVFLSAEPTGSALLQYVSMHFDFMSERPDYPRLIQRFMMARGRGFERLARKYFLPVSIKFQGLIERGIKSGELHASDSAHTAMSLVALTVFYFAAAPTLKVLGHTNPYGKVELARRKKEVLAFIRRALFINPEAYLK
ncbi:MAG TPA: TetR/AcrR family transcriptional regulator [Terriglobia bacterium]|nr:TetR/AcrR family transcriptional regulator [Terriglobia bacterium]